jgi:PAS domain S-box-containing protein
MALTRKLSFRLAAPVVVLTVIVWAILYFFVVHAVRSFTDDRAERDLQSISREALNTCNRAFDELARAGRLKNPTRVDVEKALTLGELDNLFKEFDIQAVIWKLEGDRRVPLLDTTQSDATLLNAMAEMEPHSLFDLDAGENTYYAYGNRFQPWGWSIVLLRNTAAYLSWADRFRTFYATIGGLLLVMALGLILFENKLLRQPVESIVQGLRKQEPPEYEGIEELEFLSRSIADMMKTLADREARLRESEIRYRTIFETTGTAILIAEHDTTISLVNKEFLAYTGYTKDEVEGKKSWREIVEKGDLDRIKAIHELRQTNPESAPRQYEFTLIDKHNGHRHVLSTADIIPGTKQTIASLIDITDRKKEELQKRLEQEARAAEELRRKNLELGREIEAREKIEQSLRASEERFRAVFETAEDCVFIKNTKLEYTHVNPAYLSLLDMPLPEVVGKDDDTLPLDRDYAARARGLEMRVLNGETFDTEHVLTWKDWPVSLNVVRFPLRDTSEKIFGICGIARDVSDRTVGRNDPPATSSHVYQSPAIKKTIERVNLAAQSDSTVLFLGESGTGKDHWARFLHSISPRGGGPFHAINCAALSPDLVESELFGHVRGAFTGARGRKRGLLELAEGGTLLLNEIGEMPAAMQSKLLTFLDTRNIVRLGGEKNISVDTRILAATNRDLRHDIEQGRFRADLYYRLDVISITVPELRNRKPDIPVLVHELLSAVAQRMGVSQLPSIQSTAMNALMEYEWPGNVRELRNVLERALILCHDDTITVSDLGLNDSDEGEDLKPPAAALFDTLPFPGMSFQDALNETKRFLIQSALEQSGGNIKEAAKLLGMTRNSIDHHIRQLGISHRKDRGLN